MIGIIRISDGVHKLMSKEKYEEDEHFIKESGFRLMKPEEIKDIYGYVPVDVDVEDPEKELEKAQEAKKKAETEAKKLRSENLKLKKQIKETPSQAKEDKSAK